MPCELEQIKQIFDNYLMPLSMEWLESCIDWCRNTLPANYTLRNLQNMVYQQWLILDLRAAEMESLPKNLSSQKKYSLTGVYYVQLMQLIDISKPKLWQLQRIRNNVAKNTESETDFGKRVLQLTLTDGVQEIQAMEFKPIPCLSINLTPGTKFKIIGPVMVRNGRLMLEEEHLKNLGGSVDDLAIEYAEENVLARALGLPENPNPHMIDEKILEVTQANTTSQQNPAANHQIYNSNQNRGPNQPTMNPLRQNVAKNMSNVSASNTTNSSKQAMINQHVPPEFEVDDELLRELEEDFEENSVRVFKQSITATQCSKPVRTANTVIHLNSNLNTISIKSNRDAHSPDLFDEIDEELLNEHLENLDTDCNIIENREARENVANRKATGRLASLKKSDKYYRSCEDRVISSSQKQTTNSNEVITLDDSFDDIDIDSHLDNIDKEMAELPCSTQKINNVKKKLKSPELKKPKSLRKSPVKKMTQVKLSFGNISTSKMLPGISKENFNFYDDDDANDFENPFSIYTKSSQKRPCSLEPLNIPAVSKTPNTSKPLSGVMERESSTTPLKNTTMTPPSVPSTSKHFPSESTNKNLSGQSKLNVMSIEKIRSLLPNVGKGKFKIKGKFVKVAEKLKTTKTAFYLAIIVSDDTGQVTVEVHSDIVASFAQIKPERLSELRELATKSDESTASEIFQALRNLHHKCLALDNVLELQITRGEKYPLVVNIVD